MCFGSIQIKEFKHDGSMRVKTVEELLNGLESEIKHKPKVKKMEKINSDDLTDLEVAKLWRGLEHVDECINDLIHTKNFNFAEKTEKAIKTLQEMRKQQAQLVSAVHKLKNQIGRQSNE